MLKSGDLVRMSESLKAKLRGKCGDAGKHLGPFDPETQDCYGCSSAHVEEFGDCVGVVQGPLDYGSQRGPEVDVSWKPSNLRYGYAPEDLVGVDP